MKKITLILSLSILVFGVTFAGDEDRSDESNGESRVISGLNKEKFGESGTDVLVEITGKSAERLYADIRVNAEPGMGHETLSTWYKKSGHVTCHLYIHDTSFIDGPDNAKITKDYDCSIHLNKLGRAYEVSKQ